MTPYQSSVVAEPQIVRLLRREKMIGLERGVLRLEPYSSEWSHLYEEEAHRIRRAIGAHILDIQHVGSTAIPGMLSKPIIDIAIAVHSFEQARICIAPLERIGYEYRGEQGIARRHYFVKGDPSTHHIHMHEITLQEWQDYIRFRGALREDKRLAKEYAFLKEKFYSECGNNREAYQDRKAPFITRILKEN